MYFCAWVALFSEASCNRRQFLFYMPNRLYRLIINIGIIPVKAFSLYCHSGSNLRLFNYVRYVKDALTMKSSIWPHIYIYHKNNLTKQHVI